jgi:hypothetical protein
MGETAEGEVRAALQFADAADVAAEGNDVAPDAADVAAEGNDDGGEAVSRPSK